MSFLETLFFSIADELKKPREIVIPYIKTLEENWFDTPESLQEADDSTFEKLKIPLKLVQMMRAKLRPVSTNEIKEIPAEVPIKEIPVEAPIKEIPLEVPPKETLIEALPQKKVKREDQTHEEKPPKKETSSMISEEQFILFLLNDLKLACQSMETYKQTLTLLKTICKNIVSDPGNPNYRKIKLTNKKFLECISPFAPALDLLKKVGFEFDSELMFLTEEKQNFPLLVQLLEIVEHELTELGPSFNPYQSYVTGSKEFEHTQKLKKEGQESFIEKLEELKRKREKLIKPIIDRKVTVYKVSANKTLKQLQNEFEDNTTTKIESLDQNDPEIKHAIQAASKFSSKSKKEFEEMIQKPFFIETTIRIKLPNNMIWEAIFTPKETLKMVYETLKLYLVLPNLNGYLFQTPPFKKMTEKEMAKTLEELESVPSGIFHYALEDRNLQAELKELIRGV